MESTYRVEHRKGVTLVFGALPTTEIRSVTKGGTRDDVISPALAEALGATFAFGTQAAVDALLNALLAEKLAGREGVESLRELPPEDQRVVTACMRGIGILPSGGDAALIVDEWHTLMPRLPRWNLR